MPIKKSASELSREACQRQGNVGIVIIPILDDNDIVIEHKIFACGKKKFDEKEVDKILNNMKMNLKRNRNYGSKRKKSRKQRKSKKSKKSKV